MGAQASPKASRIPPHDRDAEDVLIGLCIISPDARAFALDRVRPEQFYDRTRRVAFEVVRDLVSERRQVNELTVRDALARREELSDENPGLLLHGFVHLAGASFEIGETVRIVREKWWRRELMRSGLALADAASNGSDPEQLAALGDKLRELTSPDPDPRRGPASESLEDFLATDQQALDWLLPGILERADRLILTGREGSGKSTMLTQIAVQAAAGVHSFGGDDFEPLRVLLVDCENPRPVLERRLRSLRIAAGDRIKPGSVFVALRPEGLDLATDNDDRVWLTGELKGTEAELIVLGPIWKLASGDPNDEQAVKPVVAFLDRMRARFGVAILLEAHMPHEGHGRPYGWSGWRRWPDVGLELTETGLLKPWRPPRHETPGIPPAVQRGGAWPFTPATRARDVLWARIVSTAEGRLSRPTVRELADELGASVGSVQNAIADHREGWEALFDE